MKAGEILTVTKDFDATWWEGKNANGDSGYFLKKDVEELELGAGQYGVILLI